jgi:predicted alpha/beta hydrolase family esterase
MRTADCEILIVPGLANAGPDHWLTRWEQKLSSARRVEQADWDRPTQEAWVGAVVDAVARATRPVILVAHSLGVLAVVEAAPQLPRGRVQGAFLVAMPDTEAQSLPGVDPAFGPISREPLPFPSILVASRTDPHCSYERAEDFAYAWGSALADAGDAGHLNTASGHGPWPEGLMRFAGFLAKLQPA